MKTVSMRLRGMKGELEELGEESEGVENISQMQGKILNLTHGAVNIFDNQGEFRSTYDILMDIAAVYKDLTSTEQADLLETIAGKNRANDVAAFLSNAENAAGMVEAAENSAGSAAAENAKYLESLQGRITSLQASLQTLSVSFLNSDFLSGAVGGVNDFVQAITGLINEVGPIPALMGAVGAAMSVMDKGPIYFDNTTKQVKVLGKSLSELKGIFSSLGSGDKVSALASSFGDDNNPLKIIDKRLEQEKKAIQKYNELMTPDANGNRKTTKQDAMDIAFSGQQQGLRDYVATLGDAKVEMEEWEKVSKRAALQTMAQSNSFKSGIMILDDYNKKTKEQRIEMSKMAELSGSNVGNYISTLNGADARIGGLAKTTALATAKTIAMDAALSLAQGGLMMLGSMALDFAVNGLMSIINRASEVKEAVEDATQSFANSKKQLSDNKQSFSDAAQTYAELSNGVSRTGENLSLSATQYEEYANAVNTIADMTPSLVSGYDAQGNAILNTKGNVEALTDAYNDLIIAENNKLLNGDGEDYGGLSDISEDLANDVKSLSDQKRVADSIQEIFDSGNIDAESIRSNIRTTVKSTASAVRDELEAAGKEVEGFDLSLPTFLWDDEKSAEYLSKAFQQFPDVLKGMVSNYESALDSSVSEMRSAMSAHMETAFLTDQYAKIDDETYAMASSIVSGIDSAMISQLNSSGGSDAVMNYVDNIMSAFNTAMSDTQRQQFEDAFNLSDAFQEGDVSLGEYKRQLEDVSAMIDSLNVGDDVKNQLKLSLNIDDVKQQYDELYNYLTKGADEKGKEAAKGLIDGLNSEEMTVALNMVADGEIDVSDLDVDSVRQKIQDEVERQRILNFELDIEVETDSLAKLNTAISESNGAMGLAESSIDAVISRYADLEGYDPAALFEKTTTGVRLNEEALEALETQYVKTNKASQQQKIDALVQEYMQLQDAINSTTDAAEKEANQNRLADIEEEIQEAQSLMAAYDGLTSAYKKWTDAQSGGQSGDMYRQMLEGRENAVALANEGRWGNTELQNYIKMFSAEGSLDNATPQQYADAWADAIYKANRYLTEGQEGANRFFQDLYDKGSQLIEMNEDGSFTIKPGVEVEDLAREGGVANSTVESIVGNLQEYGADIQIGIDEKSVDELVAEAKAATQQAEDVLKQSLGQDFELGVDVNVESVEDADSKLQELQSQKDQINNDPTIDVTAKQTGLDAIDSQIKAIIAQKIQLEQPAFMSVDTSGLDASTANVVAKAQEMQQALNELNNLQMQKEYGIEIDQSQLDSANQKVQELAQSIADNKDLKMSLGFEEGTSADEILAGFKENKVEVPITANADGVKSATDEISSSLDNIEDKDVTLSVNVDGDADEFSKAAESAQKLQGVESSHVNLTANLSSNINENIDAVDNLETFAEGAKKLEGVKSTTVHLNAYLDSNLHGQDKNEQLGNLDSFVDGIEKLKPLAGDTEVRLNAYMDSNIWGDKEEQLNNLDEFADGLNKLRPLAGNTEVRLNAYLDSDIWGNDKKEQLSNLDEFADRVNSLHGLNGTTEVRLNAYLDSDVWGDKEEQLENLDEFADVAQKFQGVGDTTVHINAYLDSDVWGDDKEEQLGNLDEFASVAKELQGVGDTTVHLNAYMDSDVWGEDKEEQLSNLDEFASAAQKLQGIGDTEVHLKAYLDSDVWGDDKSAQLSNLDEFASAAQELQGVGNTEVSIKAYLDSNLWGDKEQQLPNLDTFAESAQKLAGVESKSVSLGAYLDSNLWGDKEQQLPNLDTFADAASNLQGLSSTTVSIGAYLDSNLWGDDKGEQLGNLGTFADAAHQLSGLGSVSVSVSANLSSVPDEASISKMSSFADAAQQLQSVSNVNVTVTTSADIAGLESIKNSLTSLSASGVMHGYSATVNVTVNSSAVDAYTPPEKSGIAKYTVDSSAVDAWSPGTKTGTVNWVNNTSRVKTSFTATGTVNWKNVSGTGGVNGTAHVNGTAGGRAFKQGKWGATDSGTALMGELGPEIIVRGDKWFTVGDDGAGFYQYKKGDIIFNHIQAKELLENGYVSSSGGRGRAFVEGTAFASISGSTATPKPAGGGSVTNITNNYNYNTSKSASSSAKKEADEFSETLDWIEVAIDRIERALNNLNTVASSVYRDWSERNSALNESMTVTRQEIELQQRAYDRYMQEANSVGLSADWIEKIQNGMIDIQTIGDEALNDQIERYKEYYEKALDAKDAVLDLTEALGDLAQQKFENVEKQFAGALNALEFVQGDIEAYVKREELEGHFVSEKYYTALMDNVHQQAEQLRAQREEMIKVRDEAVNAGTWQVGDENWDKQNEAINEVSLSIHELGNQWAEYHNAIRDTKWEVFDLLQDRISRVADEAQFLIDLMSNEKLFEDNGQLTDKGWATMGLYGQQYNVYMNQADRYAQEIKELEALMAEDPANMDVADRYYELIDAQQEAILSAEQMKDSIKDMVSEGIDLELEHLDDLIDKYLEALQAQKD